MIFIIKAILIFFSTFLMLKSEASESEYSIISSGNEFFHIVGRVSCAGSLMPSKGFVLRMYGYNEGGGQYNLLSSEDIPSDGVMDFKSTVFVEREVVVDSTVPLFGEGPAGKVKVSLDCENCTERFFDFNLDDLRKDGKYFLIELGLFSINCG